ncbi:hypothetical protein NU08_0563 [Flavobacterium anhuiense]|uniref:Uncharacterized protein n=1 Tax=Flavobacterium anhuiense TaxID=459526 RepID=A0A444W5X4_9FLAO|nr:hypothetical protein NU08_0563 [Flavobacterium anhuiense]
MMKKFKNKERRCIIYNLLKHNIKNPKFQIKLGVWDFLYLKI